MERITGVPGSVAVSHDPGLLAAARALTAAVDYGSLALWQGRVAHGLRFTSHRPGGAADPPMPAPAGPGLANPRDGAAQGGRGAEAPAAADPAHREACAHDLPVNERPAADPASAEPAPREPATGVEQLAGLDAASPASSARRLLALAPGAIACLLADDDEACRFQLCGFCGPATAQARWVSVCFGGWAAAVPAGQAAQLTGHFADRHPTSDLFDLGDRWAMVEIDVVEAFVRTGRGVARLDMDDARSLLAG